MVLSGHSTDDPQQTNPSAWTQPAPGSTRSRRQHTSHHVPACLVTLQGQTERQMTSSGHPSLSSTPSGLHHTCHRRRRSTPQVTERRPRHPRRRVMGLPHRRPAKCSEKSDQRRGLPTSRRSRIIWASSCWSWRGGAACGSCRRGAQGRRPVPPP